MCYRLEHGLVRKSVHQNALRTDLDLYQSTSCWYKGSVESPARNRAFLCGSRRVQLGANNSECEEEEDPVSLSSVTVSSLSRASMSSS